MKKTYILKIILHNYVLYKGDPTYIGTFPVNLRMTLIFTDFLTGNGSAPHAALDISDVNIRGILTQLGKFQYRSDHTYIKYNCAILFLGYMSS